MGRGPFEGFAHGRIDVENFARTVLTAWSSSLVAMGAPPHLSLIACFSSAFARRSCCAQCAPVVDEISPWFSAAQAAFDAIVRVATLMARERISTQAA